MPRPLADYRTEHTTWATIEAQPAVRDNARSVALIMPEEVQCFQQMHVVGVLNKRENLSGESQCV